MCLSMNCPTTFSTGYIAYIRRGYIIYTNDYPIPSHHNLAIDQPYAHTNQYLDSLIFPALAQLLYGTSYRKKLLMPLQCTPSKTLSHHTFVPQPHCFCNYCVYCQFVCICRVYTCISYIFYAICAPFACIFIISIKVIGEKMIP